VEKFIAAEKLDAIEARTRQAGGEVVKLLGSGSAFVSPSWAALEMAEAIIFDKKKILPVCTLLKGEYGVDGLFIGVPVVLGAKGIEKIIVMDLTDKEKAAFAKSVASVKKSSEEVLSLTK
jgi:malate dehydrogenase